jgi:hypothetical protein
MKEYVLGILALILCLSVTACQGKQEISNASSSQTSSASPSSQATSSILASSQQPESKSRSLDAKGVADSLKSKGLPIENIIVYTEATDENKLLGRPHQYISKVNFADKRAEQPDSKNPVGGSVEVFNNEADAKTRYDYVDSIVKKGGSMFAQYLYLNDNVLLRIDGALTPSQAKEYQTAFSKIMK